MTTYYRKSEDGSVMDFSSEKYANDCLATEKSIVQAWNEKYYLDDEVPTMPPEMAEAKALEEAKEERAAKVAGITVTIDGMEFQGDETSQNRMSRVVAVAAALGVDLDATTQMWILADNTIAYPTIRQLARALEAAGGDQTDMWALPYQG